MFKFKGEHTKAYIIHQELVVVGSGRYPRKIQFFHMDMGDMEDIYKAFNQQQP